jgi:hypothetical protein
MTMHIGTMNVLDATGHTEIKWDRRKRDEVQLARDAFNAMRSAGHSIFRVRKGEPGERITEFDPDAEKLMVIPHLVGG